MSDTYNALIVAFERDLTLHEVQRLRDAIEQMRGVLKVTARMADSQSYISDERAKRELGEKLFKVLYP